MKKILISVFIFILILAFAMTGYIFYKQHLEDEKKTQEDTIQNQIIEQQEIIEEPQPIDYGYTPIGQWGVASKYSSKDNQYEDVYVGVETVYRGTEAKKIINEYMENNEYLTYNELKDGLEWIVVEYVIFFGDYSMGSNGANSDIKTKIKGYGENEDIVIGNKTYKITTQDISNRSYTKDERIVRKICCTNTNRM